MAQLPKEQVMEASLSLPLEEPTLTPGRAIRKICVACVGSSYAVEHCGGDGCLGGQGDKNGVCYFYPYRLGKGRPSVKLIRKFCLECMGESSFLVAECAKPSCPVHQYRFGRNPKRAGQGDISRIKRAVTG